MPCAYCSAQFTLTRWKSKCNQCSINHCSQCMIERKCKPCHAVISTNFHRSLLLKLKVKDLRLYLDYRHLPIDTVKEKHELVRRIQRHANVFEPDLETHTEAYNTYSRPSAPVSGAQRQTEERVAFQPSREMPPQENNPDIPTPTYSETQRAYATASEFLFTNVSTRLNSHTAPPANSSSASTSTSTPKGELLKLSEIKSEDEIRNFSVRQLKFLLKDSLVDYHGLLEKSELMSRALNLYEDNRQNQQTLDAEASQQPTSDMNGESNLCKICFDNPVDCLFLECAHMVTCIGCSKAVRECPICRENIVRTVRVFKS